MKSILDYKDEAAMFISRTGASKAGLKALAMLPKHLTGFHVVGPVTWRGDTGYFLQLTLVAGLGPVRNLTNEALDALL